MSSLAFRNAAPEGHADAAAEAGSSEEGGAAAVWPRLIARGTRRVPDGGEQGPAADPPPRPARWLPSCLAWGKCTQASFLLPPGQSQLSAALPTCSAPSNVQERLRTEKGYAVVHLADSGLQVRLWFVATRLCRIPWFVLPCPLCPDDSPRCCLCLCQGVWGAGRVPRPPRDSQPRHSIPACGHQAQVRPPLLLGPPQPPWSATSACLRSAEFKLIRIFLLAPCSDSSLNELGPCPLRNGLPADDPQRLALIYS